MKIGERHRERDRKEKEQVEKQDSVQKDMEPYYPPSPINVPRYNSEVAPALTDTLVPVPENTEQENKDTELENKDTEQEGNDAEQEEET